MNASVDITNYLPFLATLLGGGVAVTLAAQAIKRVFGLNSGHVIHLMVVAVSVLLAVAQYLIQNKAKLPVEVLGVSGATIYGVSQFVYNEAGFFKTLLSRVNISLSDPATAAAPVTTSGTTETTTVVAAPAAPVEAAPAADPAASNGEFNA